VHCFKSDVLARPRELAPSKTWLTSPATGPFGLGRNSHGVSCLLSTYDDLNAGSRRPPASPPAGFDYPLGSGCSFRSYPSVERTGALPRLSSSEVLPLTDRSLSPVSDPLAVSREHPVRGPPNEGWTRHRLQGFYPGENPLAFARHRQNAGHARSLTACLAQAKEDDPDPLLTFDPSGFLNSATRSASFRSRRPPRAFLDPSLEESIGTPGFFLSRVWHASREVADPHGFPDLAGPRQFGRRQCSGLMVSPRSFPSPEGEFQPLWSRDSLPEFVSGWAVGHVSNFVRLT